MKTTILVLFMFANLGVAGAALAQSNRSRSEDDGWVPVKHLEFSDEDIQGGWLGPDGELLVVTERAQHSSLIEIRQGFEAELIKTMENR